MMHSIDVLFEIIQIAFGLGRLFLGATLAIDKRQFRFHFGKTGIMDCSLVITFCYMCLAIHFKNYYKV